MHELGLCTSIVDAIERRAGTRAVARVKVRVGRFHHVHAEAFDQSFEVAASGTVAEGAEAVLFIVPLEAACAACGATSEVDEVVPACPACGAFDVALNGGDELVLESIEYRA